MAGAFYHSVLLLLPHAVGLARLRAGRMVPDMPDIGVDELEFLIRTQWLAESEAADRRAIGCAIARAVTQN